MSFLKKIRNNISSLNPLKRDIQPGLFINSIPKAGTHYLRNIFYALNYTGWGKVINAHCGEYWMLNYNDYINSNGELINRDGIVFADTSGGTWASHCAAEKIVDNIFQGMTHPSLLLGHALYSPELHQYISRYKTPQVVLFRNPLDVAIALTMATHDTLWKTMKPFNQKYRSFVLGATPYSFDNLSIGIVPMERIYRNMEMWLGQDDVYPFFFEDIMGDKGGGSTKLATKVIGNFLNLINVKSSNEEIEKAIDHAFGNSPTFRKGLISNTSHFETILDPEVKETLTRCVDRYNKIRRAYSL